MVSQFVAGSARPPGCILNLVTVPAPSNHQHPEFTTPVILVTIVPTKPRYRRPRRTTEVEPIPMKSKIKQNWTYPLLISNYFRNMWQKHHKRLSQAYFL
jgi:hypothetical protein